MQAAESRREELVLPDTTYLSALAVFCRAQPGPVARNRVCTVDGEETI